MEGSMTKSTDARVRRSFLFLLILAVAAVGACNLLLPERFAVNAPIGQLLFGRGRPLEAESVEPGRMKVPPGFEITVFAEGIANARGLRFAPSGALLVTSRNDGQVWLLEPDRDGDGQSDGQRVLLGGLNRPQGLDFHEGWLYVAETDAIGRVAYEVGEAGAGAEGEGEGEAGRDRVVGEYERIVDDIPGGGRHNSRSLRFGPDGLLYITVGSSCDVCEEDDPTRRAAMLRYRPDGSGEESFATGLRNSVGFDWQPGTGHLYATDNGRDMLGNDFPPCELNRIEAGGFYGWPYAHGDRVPDPDFGEGNEARIAASIPPAHPFRAHNAPLGMTFVRDPRAPESVRGAALVALHGSWNRQEKDGYKVVSLHWRSDGSIEERDFATGFLVGEHDLIGRPTDVAEGPDRAFYIADDYAGVVWRASY